MTPRRFHIPLTGATPPLMTISCLTDYFIRVKRLNTFDRVFVPVRQYSVYNNHNPRDLDKRNRANYGFELPLSRINTRPTLTPYLSF